MINKFQLVTLIIIAAPILNILLLKFFKKNLGVTTLFNKLIPITLLSITVMLLLNNVASELIILTPLDRLSISFDLNRNSLIFLIILDLFWLLFVIYLQKFLSLSSAKNSVYFLESFIYIVIALTLLAASSSLLSILIFYQIVTILFYQYSNRFLHKKDDKSSLYFSAVIYAESLILMVATIYAYQHFASLNIEYIGEHIGSLNKDQQLIFMLLLISPTLIFAIFPFSLFYRKINLNPLIIFVLFFFLFFLSHSYLFIKFYFEIFKSINISNFILTILEVIFLINILASSTFLVFAKGLKSSFFYLFFQQLILAIYSTILLLFFKNQFPILPLISFAASFFIMVFCLSNILLFLENSKKRKQHKIFGDLKISIILLLIAIFNIASILPSIGLQVSFLVISKIIEEKLVISAVIYAISTFSVIIFFIKTIFPLLLKDDEHEQFIQDEELAIKIDRNGYLIMPSIIFVLSIFAIPIIIYFTQ